MLLRELTDLNVPLGTDISDLALTWESLLTHLPGWFWAIDETYTLTYLSENVGRVTGTVPEDLIGISILDPSYGDVRTEAGIHEYYKALKAQKPFQNLCYERNMKDGTRVMLMDSAVPVFDSDGVFRGFHGLSIHVSHATEKAGATSGLVFGLKTRADALEEELSRRNAELEANNKLQSEVLEAMGEGLIVTSHDDLLAHENTVTMVNPAYRALFDLSVEDVHRGTPVRNLVRMLVERGHIPADQDVLRIFQENIKAGRPVLIDILSQKRSCSVKSAKRRNGGYILVHTDVTDLRAQNVMLQQARDAAEVAAETKSNFLATMSHEIRTPMNGIVGMVDMLSETKLAPQQGEFVETIRSSALALTNLISDILDFSKIEAGRLDLIEAPYALRPLLEEICGLVHPLAHSKGLRTSLTVAQDVPEAVIGDSFRLRQILLNLLGNAVKFSQVGCVTLNVSICPESKMICFDVADTGMGIPAELLDYIFTPFEQVDAGLRRGFEGSGLGLAITRSLTDAMQGIVSVTSEVNFGSTFRVELPLPTAQFTPRAKPFQPAKISSDLTGIRILVAEDNRTNQLVVRRMLERAGVEITCANNGQEACDIYFSAKFDLVLMDLSMPKMSGLEACTAIRAFEAEKSLPKCPIVALTGNAFDRDRAAAMCVGMNDFLAKPVRLHQAHQLP